MKMPSSAPVEEEENNQIDDLSEEDNGKTRWLWKADDDTKVYHAANRHSTRTSLACVTFNTTKPLDYEKLVEAFHIVQRGCINLRLGLCPRGNELWVKEYLDPDIDFQILPENTDSTEVLDQCTAEGFSSTDKPHVRLRLIPKSKDTPCVADGVKAEFPHQYDYIFHVNHAFCDGINYALAIHLAHTILERLLSGKSFELKKPFGDLSAFAELEALEENIKDYFRNNPYHLTKVVDEMPPKDKPLLINEVFGKPQTPKSAWTKHVTRIIDADVLHRFHEKSKEVGVTFNSSLVALINTAFVDLMKEAGVEKESYNIAANHLINLRRYFKNQKGVALGTLQHPLSHSSVVSSDVMDNFWEYTMNLHKDLSQKLKSGSVLEQKVVSKMESKTTSAEELFTNPNPVRHDFCVSNIGDMTAFIPGIGKHVKISDLVSYNVIHNFIHSHMHQVVSYRGRCRYTISYDTSYLTEGDVNKIADKIMALMDELSK